MTAFATPHLVLAGAAGLTAVLGAACGLGGDSSDDLLTDVPYSPIADQTYDDDIHLRHTGTPERITLPGPPGVGDVAMVEIAIETHVERGGHAWSSGVELSTTDRILEASPTGTVFETTVVRRATTGVGSDTDERWESLIGTPLLRHVDETGQDTVGRGPRNATRVPLWAQDVLSPGTIGIALPSEPVGVGAVWTTYGFLDDELLPDVLVETRFDLVAFDDDRYEIAVAQRRPIAWVVDGELMTGSLEATGTITGSRETRLDVQLDLDRTVAVSLGDVDTFIEYDLSIDSST